MSRWVIKLNRRETSNAHRPHDWAVALSGPRTIECCGRAEGRGGEMLASLSPGNVALAYQVDERSFHGVVRIITVNSTAKPAYLVVDRILRFERPVRLADLAASEPLLIDVGAFTTGSAADTMRRLTPDEYRLIMEGCGIDASARSGLNL